MKTHKGTQKRVKITGSGKIMVRKAVPKRMRKNKRSLYEMRGDMACPQDRDQGASARTCRTASSRHGPTRIDDNPYVDRQH